MAAPAYQEPVLKVVGSVQSYVESSTDYIRLQVFKTLMRLMTSLVKSSVLGVLITFGLAVSIDWSYACPGRSNGELSFGFYPYGDFLSSRRWRCLYLKGSFGAMGIAILFGFILE